VASSCIIEFIARNKTNTQGNGKMNIYPVIITLSEKTEIGYANWEVAEKSLRPVADEAGAL
jgi:hypothetical protein